LLNGGGQKLNPQIVDVVKKANLSYLSENALINLYKQIKKVNKLQGIIIEAGCALGGSGIVIAKAKQSKKKFYIYDIFGMIPSPSENDGPDVLDRYSTIKSGQSEGINNDEYYGYKKDLLNEVKNNFTKCGIKLDHTITFVKGLYQDTLKINEPVSFAHIDCDWYESVIICLNILFQTWR
jgi:asparagine synthase (glutamine-hydrolysing)